MSYPPPDPPTTFVRPGVPDRDVERFACDADLTVYWPWVRPCWEETPPRGQAATHGGVMT